MGKIKNGGIFLVTGKVKHNSYFGSHYDRDEKTFICYVDDYDVKKLLQGQNEIYLGVTLDTSNNTLNVFGFRVMVETWLAATPSDTRLFNRVLKKNNLKLETRKITRHLPCGDKEEERTTLWYISKDDFRMTLNGQEMTYKELQEYKPKENEKVILRGDNGYSHIWAETFPFAIIVGHIDQQFSNDHKDGRNGAIPYRSEMYGWETDNLGRLVVRTSVNDIHFSEVSNS